MRKRSSMTKEESERRSRDLYYRREYGITLDIYEVMLKRSNGCCYICNRPPKNKRLCVDHVHSKHIVDRHVRGLLCFRCNKYLVGRYKHIHANLFFTAAEYL